MSHVNTALLNQVLEHIRANPQNWDQQVWARRDPDCGTAMCVAGWAVAIGTGGRARFDFDNESAETAWVDVDGQHWPIDTLASRLLGLDSGEDEDLFRAKNTLTDLHKIAAELTTDGGEPR